MGASALSGRATLRAGSSDEADDGRMLTSVSDDADEAANSDGAEETSSVPIIPSIAAYSRQ